MSASYYYTTEPDVLLELHASLDAFSEFEKHVAFVRTALGLSPVAPAIVMGWAPEQRIVGFRFPDGAPDGWEPVKDAGDDVFQPGKSDIHLIRALGIIPSPIAVLLGNGMPGLVIAENVAGERRVFQPGVRIAGAEEKWASSKVEALWVRWDVELGPDDQPDGKVWIRYVGKGNPFSTD